MAQADSRQEVIVVGGGPAGLMAAGQAATRGLQVILLEKKHLPARKLGITGKGRCNLTNTAANDDFLRTFGHGAKFMRFALGRFSSRDLVSFFNSLGLETEEERGGRVFPRTQQASDVVRALVGWVKEAGVKIKTAKAVRQIVAEKGRVRGGVTDKHGTTEEFFRGENIVIATGGASYPATGSTGDGYALARALGHEIVPVYPGLVPLETKGDTAPMMQGLSLRNVRAGIYVQGKKQVEDFGEMLFTHFGVSGPIVLSLSKDVVRALSRNLEVKLVIDLKPAVSHTALKSRISSRMHARGRKKISNLLKEFLPIKMIPVFLKNSDIDPDKPGSDLSASEQKALRMWCKELCMDITGYRSFNEAIITSGGIKLSEVDPRTMQSRKVQGLYFAGEVLDVDAGTGGFNLQAAFSTGWVAGNSVTARQG
ncbi:NAD(P)/FAD-dependent oxidoreductase [Desulfonatronospira sp.]|uniref:NAD(P)/FAD-dependent oxidoreductase n=1 Tax=Desulfonatronospira sp. TaxID=1962951 RepID=UPI0025C4EF5D|nr:NAD(P)/FAD-dependent oxidoreductase [Desulfonatronospira sp.]